MTKFLLVDDDSLVREATKSILEFHYPSAQFGEADNAKAALGMLEASSWDVVLLDLSMPGTAGLFFLTNRDEVVAAVPVIVLTSKEKADVVSQALESGAKGFVIKSSAKEELPLAVAEVLSGRYFVTTRLSVILDDFLSSTRAGKHTLSRQEREVLLQIAQGQSVKEIAYTLDLNEKTVRTYRSRILEKLQLHSDTEIVKYAFEHGLI